MLVIKQETDEELSNSTVLADQSISDNEQNTEKKTRSAKTKRRQYEKLISFMGGHSRRASDCDWDQLTLELNSIGPPTHTSSEWRKVWTDFKGNQKRKLRAAKNESEAVKPEEFGINRSILQTEDNRLTENQHWNWTITDELADPLLDGHAGQKAIVMDETLSRMDHFHSELLNKFDLVIEQQTNLNVKIDTIVEQQRRLNENMEKFIKLAECKFSND